jgi:hypothetical protein
MRGLVRALDPPLRLEDLHSGEKMSYLERMPLLPRCSLASPKSPWTGFQDEDDPGPFFTPDSLDCRTSRSLIGGCVAMWMQGSGKWKAPHWGAWGRQMETKCLYVFEREYPHEVYLCKCYSAIDGTNTCTLQPRALIWSAGSFTLPFRLHRCWLSRIRKVGNYGLPYRDKGAAPRSCRAD